VKAGMSRGAVLGAVSGGGAFVVGLVRVTDGDVVGGAILAVFGALALAASPLPVRRVLSAPSSELQVLAQIVAVWLGVAVLTAYLVYRTVVLLGPGRHHDPASGFAGLVAAAIGAVALPWLGLGVVRTWRRLRAH
jgi:hypothetical protein